MKTDYTRHLEEITRHTESLLLEIVQECMLKGSGDEGTRILRTWENFSTSLCAVTESRTMAEETQLFLKKLQNLQQIWKDLLSNSEASDSQQRLKLLQEKGQTIATAVMKEGNLNAGGKFEWVDSILIKCLQDGSWLLIDNVNLCSPAVLDRLNALLEPNGVLTIGERGVKENGEMVEIKPHKDFRLFLTMDPKNGEISRAMRNRGIEIYMLNEGENGITNWFDVKSLINQAGLKDNAYIEALLRMHQFISNIVLGEKLNINHLLQASFLISQQILRGKHVFLAFYSAIIDVYYKSRSPNEFDTNDALNVIHEELKNILENPEGSNLLVQYYDSDVTLKTSKLSTNSRIEKIKQHGVLLKKSEESCLIQHFLINYCSIASWNDLKMRFMYMEKYMSSGEKQKFKEVYNMLQCKIFENFKSDNQNLPQDFHWLPDSTFKTNTNLSNSNKLYLLMYFMSTKALNEAAVEENPTKKEMSLLKFLNGVRSKKIEGKIDDVLETDLLNLLDNYDRFILQCLKLEGLQMNDKQAIEVVSLLHWRFILRRLINTNIQNLNLWEYKNIFANLHVHYRWFFKFSIKQLLKVLGIKIDDNLARLVNKINSSVSHDYSVLRKIAKLFQKNIDKPPPLINDKQIVINEEFQKITKNLDLYSKQNDFLKVLRILPNDRKLRASLIKTKAELDYEFFDAPEIFLQLKELCSMTNNEILDPKPSTVEMLPVFDHFARLAVMKLKHQTKHLEENLNILTETLTVPPNLLGVLERYCKTQDVRLLHEFKSEVFHYLLNAASIAPFKFHNSDSNVLCLEKKHLAHFAPILSILITNLVISDVKYKEPLKVTPFGNYREAEDQHKTLNLLLWKNLQQISSRNYDYISCETQYLHHSYREFLDQFSHILSITSSTESLTSSEAIQTCIEKIEDIYKNSEFDDLHGDKNALIKLLKQFSTEANKLNIENQLPEKLKVISDVYFILSYLKTLLNSKLPSIDPLVKIKLKKLYCSEEIEEFSNINKSYQLQNEVYSGFPETLHSHVFEIDDKIKTLQEKDFEFGKHVAVRPGNVTYAYVAKEISHNCAMFLTPQQISQLYDNLDESYNVIQNAIKNSTTIDVENYEKCGRESSQYICSYENLIDLIKKYRYNYPDIVEPLLSNITEFLYAIRLKTSLHYKLLAQYNNLKYEVDLNKDLLNVMRFPTLCYEQPDYLKAITLYTDGKTQDFITRTLQSEDNPHLCKQENFRLLKCGIQELYNISVLDGENCRILDKRLFGEFDALLAIFVKAWKQQEEELEQKRKEEESLYTIKAKTEEKEIEEHFKELFPSFHDQDFSDLQIKNLEDNIIEPSLESSRYVGVITIEDVKFVSQIHSQLVQMYTKTEWLNPPKQPVQCDFVTALIQKCKLFKLLLNKYGECLDYTMDAEIMNSLNVLIGVAQRFGDVRILDDQNVDVSRTQIKKRYDFYKDPRTEEVKGSYHILEDLRLKIEEFLNEWPEHPTLQTIKTVIQRIYNFDITSPLSRFLTGFEILLAKCHEWEQNAHAGVSLVLFTQNLIQQIIAWRKIEMNVWKDSLNNTFDRMNEPISKWWFYIYEIMLQFTQETTSSTEELISALQKFITQSNLAEFANRLDLLLTFHCHAVHLPRTDKSEIFINVLWNVHKYFKQFVLNVENKIKELRAPIEKKLKEYVKIVKWKDISYWAIKDTLEKTHKTLHQYIREFQDVLKQSALSCLTNTSTQTKSIENVGIWDRPQRHSPKLYHYTMDAATYMAKRSLSKKMQIDKDTTMDQSILTKAEKYFHKSRVLCKDAVLATKYPSLIQSLDGFVTEVIEASERLQNLELDTTLPKDKQKSQAKGILQQKRKALSDLFKALATIGLSFRTGIIQAKMKDNSKQFLIKPIDLRAAFNHINYSRNDEKLLTIWDGCEMYYTKALSRLDTLDASLKNPAKDLGIQNAERCKGFSEHLMNMVHDQKSKLVETSRILYYLRFYSNCLTTIYEEPHQIPIGIYEKIKDFLKNTLTVMEQYRIILYTCPDEANFGEDLRSVPILKPENDKFLQHKQDTPWKDCLEQINTVITTSKKLLNNLEKLRNNTPSTDFELVNPSQVPISDFDVIIKELDKISSKLEELTVIFGNIPAVHSAMWLKVQVNDIKNVLTDYSAAPNTNSVPLNLEQFKKSTEKLLEKMLVAMQNIYKKYKLNETSKDENNENPNPEDDGDLKPEHLKTLVIQDLSRDVDVLEMGNSLKYLHVLISEFYDAKSGDVLEFKTVLSQILPVVEQIILLYEYFITQQVSAYRLTCKMSSVLSNIFIDLVTKGFCVPPEFSEELNSEGQSQQAGGGLGLGEGEGERDVSDRIESEDQLEDAQPAGKEKEKQDDKDCKEEDKGIEMSEDFDSKLQDVEKGDDDEEDDKSESNEDADEQMGETEKGADQLDQQIWGSDDEDVNESGDEEQKEEKGSKGEKEGQEELAAKENNQSKDEDQEDPPGNDSKEKNKKEINEMEEPELDDEQIDPYHGNHPKYPEPEPMDLPEDLQLDDDMQDKDEMEDEENPFDIDTMKEQMPPENEPPKEDEDKKKEDPKEEQQDDADSSDDEPDVKENTESKMDTEQVEDEQNPELEENEEKSIQDAVEKTKEDEEKENVKDDEQSGMDQTHTNEIEAQAMDVDDVEAADNVQTNPSKHQKSFQPNEQVCQEDNPDKEGVGQSRMEESKTGHKGQANAQEDMSSNRQEEEKEEEIRRKPGESDSKRSLGDTTESVKKKLKTIDIQQSEQEIDSEEIAEEQRAEMYQHIKEAKGTEDQVLDTATKEQAEQQKEVPDLKNNEETEDPKESSDYVPENEEEEVETSESVKQKAEKLDSEKKKRSNKGQHPEGDILEDLQDVEIEGDVVETATVPRGGETTHHTQYSTLTNVVVPQLTVQEINQIRAEVEQQLSVWNEPPTSNEAEQAWEKISSVTSSLAQSLSEQLRLVLEPTQASRLKGDYRTGRRINMRKVIPYIASQFRKDKIWLRRTKPSKREYQIALAIDDSSSMSDNHSKELAFESVALISKALTLLESGQLSVLSFGEATEVLHKLTDTFTEKSGSKLLQKFQFVQKKTCVAKLVDFVSEMLTSAHSHSNALLAKLLIIVSDGRGIFSEGESYVQQAVRRAKLSNIFMVFVIIDNPESKDSILDIRMPVFSNGKLLGIKSYMDSFPFPFYIILRDINSLPSVLSDALRQWFEIVSNIDKQ